MRSQSISAAANAAIPIGDATDYNSFGAGIEVIVLWDVVPKFDVGASVGYSHYFGKTYNLNQFAFQQAIEAGTNSIETLESDYEDVSFLTLAAAARFNVTGKFILGTDLGYALGLSPKCNDGGFYFAPKVQYNIIEKLGIVLAYRSINIKDDLLISSFNAITLGLQVTFN